MTNRIWFKITEENKGDIEAAFGKIEELGDDDAKEIVEEFGDLERGEEVDNAWFLDDETISYELKEQEEEDSDDVPRGWNERYLNSIGMSMRDFY